MEIIVSVETSALDRATNTQRLTAIAWIVLKGRAGGSGEDEIVEQGFSNAVPPSIGHDNKDDTDDVINDDLTHMLTTLAVAMRGCNVLVSSDATFVAGLIRSEIMRITITTSRSLAAQKETNDRTTSQHLNELLAVLSSMRLVDVTCDSADSTTMTEPNATVDAFKCFRHYRKIFPRSIDDIRFYHNRRLITLTPAQHSAATAFIDARNIVVVALAGSGKTITMICRIKHLGDAYGIDFSKVLVTTFTREATRRMKAGITSIIGREYDNNDGDSSGNKGLPTVCTLDAFARKWLIKFDKISEDDTSSDAVASSSNGGMMSELLAEVLATDVGARYVIANAYTHLFCDEAQDLDPNQLFIIQALHGAGVRVFCIGDPNQSIYAFRGSVPGVMRTLEEQAEHVFVLDKNFRCAPEIVRVSDWVLNPRSVPVVTTDDTPSREGMPDTPENAVVTFEVFPDRKSMARSVADMTVRFCAGDDRCESVAIISPTNDALTGLDHVVRERYAMATHGTDNALGTTVFWTIHASKGLEFDTVILADASRLLQDVVLDTRAIARDNVSSRDGENRRIAYVGVTRAIKRLVIACIQTPSLAHVLQMWKDANLGKIVVHSTIGVTIGVTVGNSRKERLRWQQRWNEKWCLPPFSPRQLLFACGGDIGADNVFAFLLPRITRTSRSMTTLPVPTMVKVHEEFPIPTTLSSFSSTKSTPMIATLGVATALWATLQTCVSLGCKHATPVVTAADNILRATRYADRSGLDDSGLPNTTDSVTRQYINDLCVLAGMCTRAQWRDRVRRALAIADARGREQADIEMATELLIGGSSGRTTDLETSRAITMAMLEDPDAFTIVEDQIPSWMLSADARKALKETRDAILDIMLVSGETDDKLTMRGDGNSDGDNTDRAIADMMIIGACDQSARTGRFDAILYEAWANVYDNISTLPVLHEYARRCFGCVRDSIDVVLDALLRAVGWSETEQYRVARWDTFPYTTSSTPSPSNAVPLIITSSSDRGQHLPGSEEACEVVFLIIIGPDVEGAMAISNRQCAPTAASIASSIAGDIMNGRVSALRVPKTPFTIATYEVARGMVTFYRWCNLPQ